MGSAPMGCWEWDSVDSAPPPSIFHSGMYRPPDEWHQPALAADWSAVRSIRSEVNRLLERCREDKVIGSTLQAQVTLTVSPMSPLFDILSRIDLEQASGYHAQQQGGSCAAAAAATALEAGMGGLSDVLISSTCILQSPDTAKGVASTQSSFSSDFEVVVREGAGQEMVPIHVEVSRMKKYEKCPRCWKHTMHPDAHSDTCARCSSQLMVLQP